MTQNTGVNWRLLDNHTTYRVRPLMPDPRRPDLQKQIAEPHIIRKAHPFGSIIDVIPLR